MKIKIPKYLKIISTIFLVFILIYLFIYLFLPLKLNILPSSTIIYDYNGIPIGEIVYQNKIRHQEIKYDEIPEFYKKALILLEDKNFYSNNGISISGLVRSFIHNIQAGKIVEGGSTLSSQFIRNNLWLNDQRSFGKKMLEFIYAIRLNGEYNKNEILEKYVNQIYFGYLNYGLKSASKYFFGKEPSSLTEAEQIALLVIPKNIKKFDPYLQQENFLKRFGIITNVLEKNGVISSQEKKSIEDEKLVFDENHKNKLPYVSDLFNPRFEYGIETTIDFNLSNKIEEIAKNVIFELAWKNVKDYGILIIDKKTNELKVMLGGINYYGKEGQVNSTLALRQPGSTLKPFIYLLAFKYFGIKPDDTILDLPINYKTAEGYNYQPKNYSTEFKKEVSIAEALSQSINIPAIKLLEKVGIKNLLDFLHKISITSLNKSEDFYGLALALGDGEVSLYELAQAYSIFANNGEFCKIKIIKTLEKSSCVKVIDDKFVNGINEILTNRYFKLEGYPINSSLDFSDKEVFVKTGTSRNFRDNWSIGYTSNYLIGVWVGNKDASNMKGVSGATGAGEIFSRIVDFLEVNKTEPGIINLNKKSQQYLEITAPLNGEIYKIDVNKPKSIQKIKLDFSTNISYDKYFWFLNNKKIEGDFISLEIGKHKLDLKIMKDGEIISEKNVGFNVE